MPSKKRTREFFSEVENAQENEETKKLKTEDETEEEETKELHTSEEDEEDNGNSIYENMSEYERQIAENRRDNAQFIASIGLHLAKYDLKTSIAVMKTQKKTYTKPKLKLKKVIQPLRRSARVQNIAATVTPVPIETPVEINPRKPANDLLMEDVLTENDTDKKQCYSQFAQSFKSLKTRTVPLELQMPNSSSLKKFLQNFSKIQITEDRVRKVVESRAFSVAVHPTVEKVLVGAGGKWGSVGLWDVNQGLSENGAFLYYPHSKPVNCLEFSRYEPKKLFSCAYDGTLRCGHFEKNVFENIYYTPEDDDILLRNFVFISPQILLVSQSDGNVAVVDTRTQGYKADETFQASQKGLRTVDIHPTKPDYIITAGLDCNVCLWDIRKTKKKPTKICSMASGRMLNSAYFSPVTGNYILSTSQDNALRIYDSSKLTSSLTCLHSINHDTQCGRWLTKFRATWHPSREDLFVCGSMARPRQIELFSNEGQRVCIFRDIDLISSVQSLNAIHPSLNVLVGANASGKLHVFMEGNKK